MWSLSLSVSYIHTLGFVYLDLGRLLRVRFCFERQGQLSELWQSFSDLSFLALEDNSAIGAMPSILGLLSPERRSYRISYVEVPKRQTVFYKKKKKTCLQEEDLVYLVFKKFHGFGYIFNEGFVPRGIEEPSGLTGACLSSVACHQPGHVSPSLQVHLFLHREETHDPDIMSEPHGAFTVGIVLRGPQFCLQCLAIALIKEDVSDCLLETLSKGGPNPIRFPAGSQ